MSKQLLFFLVFCALSPFSLVADPLAYSSFSSSGTNNVGNPAKLNPATLTPLSWTQDKLDDQLFSFSAASPTLVRIESAGDYFLAFTMPIISGGQRITVRAQVYINNVAVPHALAESTYTRGAGDHNESSAHMSVFLSSLGVGDLIEVRLLETARLATGDSLIDGKASLYLEQIDASREVFAAFTTRRTDALGTNLNQMAAAPLEWISPTRTSPVITQNANPQEIVLTEVASYLVHFNLPLHTTRVNETATTRRPNVRADFLLDGIRVSSGSARQGYIRQDENDHDAGGQNPDNAHEDSSLHWFNIVRTTVPNQILTVTTQAEAGANPVVVETGNLGSVVIEQIPEALRFFAESTTLVSGTDWNQGAVINWDSDLLIDPTVYGRPNTSTIRIERAGDYLLTYNDALAATSNSIRLNPTINVFINGLLVPGARSKTHYIRNDSGHRESSAALELLLEDLSVGDLLTVRIIPEAGSGPMTVSPGATVSLEYKSGLRITGLVIDDSGNTIEGLNLDLVVNGQPAGNSVTNLNGQYGFDCLRLDADYTITPSLAGYVCPVRMDTLTTTDRTENFTCQFIGVDSDGDGLIDSIEAALGTAICAADTDSDGLSDFEEANIGADGFITNPLDADTDDDGLSDSAEFIVTATDPTLVDSDADGLQDGTETGNVTSVASGTTACTDGSFAGTDSSVVVFDQDPSSITNPLNADSDNGNALDGIEDANQNGRVDNGERDPNIKTDDCPRSYCQAACTERNLDVLRLSVDSAAASILSLTDSVGKTRGQLAQSGLCTAVSKRRLQRIKTEVELQYLNIWNDVWNSLRPLESSACEGFSEQCQVLNLGSFSDRVEDNLIALRKLVKPLLRRNCQSAIRFDRSRLNRKRIVLLRQIGREFRRAKVDINDYPDNVISCN